MTLDVFRDSQQGAGFVICVVFAPICILATALRVASTVRGGRRVGLEDFFALAALAFFLVYVGMLLYIFITVNGRTVVSLYLETPEQATELLKVSWAMSAQFVPNQMFAKFCLLALYYRLFSIDRAFVICLWVLAVLQLGWGVSCYLVHYFGCVPISKAWGAPGPGSCVDTTLFLEIKEPLNSAIDLAVAVLAVWMLRFLHIGRWAKFKVSLLFMVGAVSGIIGIIKTAEARGSRGTNFLDAIWDVVQMATSIICCCAPIYKTLMPDMGVMTKLRSWISRSLSSWGSERTTSTSQTPTMMMQAQKPWLHLEGWNDRDLALTEQETRSNVAKGPSSVHVASDTVQQKPRSYDMV